MSLLTAHELALRRMAKGVLALLNGIEASRAAGDDPEAQKAARELLLDALGAARFEIGEALARLEHEDGGT